MQTPARLTHKVKARVRVINGVYTPGRKQGEYEAFFVKYLPGDKCQVRKLLGKKIALTVDVGSALTVDVGS